MISGIMSRLYELFNLCLLTGLASNSIPLILFLLLNLVDALEDQCYTIDHQRPAHCCLSDDETCGQVVSDES